MRAASLALGLVLAAPAARAYCRTTTMPAQPDPTVCPAEGRPIAWGAGCAGFRFDPALLPDPRVISRAQVGTVLDRSAQAWAAVPCDPSTRAAPSFTLVRLADGPSALGYFEGEGNTNTVAFRERWAEDAYHPPDAAAVTIVTFGARSAAILDADTELNLRTERNPRGFGFATNGDPRSADLQTIVTHEFGHAMGLAHSGMRDAVMWYTAGRGEQRQAPTADDVAGVCEIYPPSRFAICDPDVRSARYVGGGAHCGIARAPGASSRARVALALALAAVIARRRR